MTALPPGFVLDPTIPPTGFVVDAPAPPPPDKYQQAAIDERNKLKAAGINTDAGAGRLGVQGATLNTADEILAGMMTPFEMIGNRTLDPREGYRYAKAKEDLAIAEGRKNLGKLATAAEIAGGVTSGGGLARAGLTFGRLLGPNAGLVRRSLASAGDAGVMGAVAGAGEGNSFDERFNNALWGGALGTGIGAAAPSVLTAAKLLASPVISNIRARINPARYAESQVARAMTEGNMTPQQIASEVTQAATEGQAGYAVADAMGNPGQRMLSTVTRAPGPGRTDVTNFLDARQAGQGRRVSNALAEGFDSPQTAAQTEARLTRARDVAADAEYNAIRDSAVPVDVSRAINRIDVIVPPGAKGNAAPDTIEAALQGVRRRLTDGNSNVIDFTALQRVRGDLSDSVEAAVRAGHGNRARLLRQVLREMDTAMEGASPGFRQANQNFATRSREIDAVAEGRDAALRGRTEDTIPRFQAMTPQQQAAFRAGYVDPLIGQTQSAASGANKARPFTSDAFRDEATAMAPGNPLMTRRLDREGRMFETRQQALGNSKTAENLADDAAMTVDPGILRDIVTGHWGGAVRGILGASKNMMTGNTPAVRAEVGRILTMRGGNLTPQDLQSILEQAVNRVRLGQTISLITGRAAAGGLAIASQKADH